MITQIFFVVRILRNILHENVIFAINSIECSKTYYLPTPLLIRYNCYHDYYDVGDAMAHRVPVISNISGTTFAL